MTAATPQDLLAVSGAYWKSFALHAGVKTGLFDALPVAPDPGSTSAEIAAKRRLDPRATAMLLTALCGIGLVQKSGPAYNLDPQYARLLQSESEDSLAAMIRHHANIADAWLRLPKIVETGEPAFIAHPDDDVRRVEFLNGMRVLARLLAPKILPHIDLAGARNLLDLGGGPATYSIAFCQAHPQLAAVVFDAPFSEQVAQKHIRNAGLEHRIRFIGGDFLKDDLGGPYDRIWISQALHHLSTEEAQNVVQRAAKTLAPNGAVLVHEFLINPNHDGPEHPALFALNMLTRTRAGKTFDQQDLENLLRRAGAQSVTPAPFTPPTGSRLFTARWT